MDIKCEFKELVDIIKLVPNPKNPNKHSDKQIDLLQRLIRHQGWRHPIIVSNRSGFVCAGHGRLLAAIKMGQNQVPVDYQDFDSEAEEYQFMVSDNTIQELSELDLSMVNVDVLDFGPDFDLDMLGIPDFSLSFEKQNLSDAESLVGDVDKKYILEVQFQNDMEMMDIHDDLVHRGYLVKVK
jgi:hypothetical protein